MIIYLLIDHLSVYTIDFFLLLVRGGKAFTANSLVVFDLKKSPKLFQEI